MHPKFKISIYLNPSREARIGHRTCIRGFAGLFSEDAVTTSPTQNRFPRRRLNVLVRNICPRHVQSTLSSRSNAGHVVKGRIIPTPGSWERDVRRKRDNDSHSLWLATARGRLMGIDTRERATCAEQIGVSLTSLWL